MSIRERVTETSRYCNFCKQDQPKDEWTPSLFVKGGRCRKCVNEYNKDVTKRKNRGRMALVKANGKGVPIPLPVDEIMRVMSGNGHSMSEATQIVQQVLANRQQFDVYCVELLTAKLPNSIVLIDGKGNKKTVLR
jgi:hypothetical protein